VAEFYSARSETITPLPWQTFAPPLTRASPPPGAARTPGRRGGGNLDQTDFGLKPVLHHELGVEREAALRPTFVADLVDLSLVLYGGYIRRLGAMNHAHDLL
jgi:hypothetical protein